MAAITRLSEDEFEDLVLEHSPRVRKLIADAEADRRAGRVVRIERVLPGDPDWRLVQARRREPLADFEAYHRKRRKKSGRGRAR